jgi:hypothetical protein
MEGKCEGCGATVLFIKEPVYEGFTRVGEVLKCTACGHTAEAETVEPTEQKKLSIFTDADRSPEIKIAGQDEQVQMCRYCVNYMVNPFTQRCGRHERVVAATDSCDDFELNEEAE